MMLKVIFLTLFLTLFLFGESVDCTQIFEQRKQELLNEIEKVDEARQSFEALKAATNALFDKQKEKLEKRKEELKQKEQELNKKREEIKSLIAKNQELLDAIKGVKSNKLSETYSKMKDSAAAVIMENLPVNEAASILFSLPAKKISKILAKMDPKKASSVTNMLKKGPPFKELKMEDKNATVQ